ncbi:hypothetical protein BGZ93_007983 [Podila epicladia]|nr:hypothetical protein BGZ92_008191 [Podila epicladia]KAG0093216.1 hypothetical protein BGZ93_007983 [Podila epicladia]
MKSFVAIAVLTVVAVAAALPAPEIDTTSVAPASTTVPDKRWQKCAEAAIKDQSDCLAKARVNPSITNCEQTFSTKTTRCNDDYKTSISK